MTVRDERITKLFETRVVEVTPSGCHIWTGGLNAHGYGMIRMGTKHLRAHRIAWEAANGPIPEGLGLMHSCDVRCCVNPSHLTPATQADNMHDMFAKGRGRIPNVRGERQGAAKITADDVREIRRLAAFKTQSEIAAMFGIDRSNVSIIVLRKGWKHVAD